MQIRHFMTPDPATVSPDDSLQRAAQLMDDLDVGVLPVCDGEKLVGIITDRDITVRATSAGQAPNATKVADAMTTDVQWCTETDDVLEAQRIMATRQIRRLPIVGDDQRLVGMLSLGDLATGQARDVRNTLDQISQPSQPDR